MSKQRRKRKLRDSRRAQFLSQVLCCRAAENATAATEVAADAVAMVANLTNAINALQITVMELHREVMQLREERDDADWWKDGPPGEETDS